VCIFLSSRRRHTRFSRDWSSTCALPIYPREEEKQRLAYSAISNDFICLAGSYLKRAHDSIFQHLPVNWTIIPRPIHFLLVDRARSEERRVGKECRSRCSEWPITYTYNIK